MLSLLSLLCFAMFFVQTVFIFCGYIIKIGSYLHNILNLYVIAGSDPEGPWFMPDILVNVRRSGEDTVGIIREVLPVCHLIASFSFFSFCVRVDTAELVMCNL